MELLLTTKIQNYIKWCLLELSTNINIDHRNYNGKNNKINDSPLIKVMKNHNSLDDGIKEIADSICDNKKFIHMLDKFNTKNLKSDDDTKKIEEDEEDFDDYDDCEIETELFYMCNNLIGLYEIESLHSCSVDIFMEKFRMDVCK